MGLEEEIERLLDEAAGPSPLAREIVTGVWDDSIGEVGIEDIGAIHSWLLAGHRAALLRMAREIDALRATGSGRQDDPPPH